MKVTIKKMGINGEGIGYLDRLPVFVPGALCGEEVDITLTEKNGRYAKGKIVHICKKSDKRIRPICEIQRRCGACPYMVCDYEEQLRFKRDDLRQSLIKYAHIDPRRIEAIHPSPKTLFYRNQCKLPCGMVDGKLVNGMYAPSSNIFVEMDTCYVHEKELEIMRKRILKVLNRYQVRAYDWHQKRGVRYLILRGFEGKFQCTLVTGVRRNALFVAELSDTKESSGAVWTKNDLVRWGTLFISHPGFDSIADFSTQFLSAEYATGKKYVCLHSRSGREEQ